MSYKPVLEILDRIITDRSIPKNVREAVERAKNALNSNKEEEVKTNEAIFILDEIVNDPNLPIHGRTMIWNAVSLLEQIKARNKKK